MSKIPYPLEKIKAIVFDIDGVLSPATVHMGDDGIPRRMANLKDGFAMVQAIRKGLKIAIISGADQAAMKERMRLIGVTDFFSGNIDKLPILKKWMATHSLNADEVAYVGDDVPDVEPMKIVGLPITPSDGSDDTKQVALYTTDAVGGYGVAREIIEEILRAQQTWPI
ncbi:MAG: HAD hydrolase family protein [Muribaculum sp.]|nr:HAD hydrolase family protein [Muribaculum sp.]